MGRHAKTFSLRKRKDTGYWFYKLKGWKGYKSTGTRRQDLALEVVQEALARGGGSLDSLRLYAFPFFIRDTCPRTQHLVGEGKETGNRHLREQRRILERYVLTDPLADTPLAEITRGDVVTFRARLLDKLSGKFRTVNKTLGVLKTIFGEAVYREDLRSNPAQGIGNTKYRVLKSGILTLEELLRLFPADTLKPWKDLTDYTAFLVAAATGMRKGEVLALRWMDIDFDSRLMHVRTAWKDLDQVGIPQGGEERITPILLWPDRVITRLQELYAGKNVVSPVDLVFCYADGRRIGNTWWQIHWEAALEKAGIDRVGRHLTPHGLRRTLNSLLRAANKDPAKLRAALGWKEEVTQDGYTEFKAEDLEDLRLG